jgi:hypothetical protein
MHNFLCFCDENSYTKSQALLDIPSLKLDLLLCGFRTGLCASCLFERNWGKKDLFCFLVPVVTLFDLLLFLVGTLLVVDKDVLLLGFFRNSCRFNRFKGPV